MTRREFDALTRVNYGTRWGNRTYYRRVRAGLPEHEPLPRDRLAERAAEIARYRRKGIEFEGLATLGIGSRFRAPASVRFLGRWPTLPEDQKGRST